MRETFETVLALWAQALQSPGEVRRRDSEHPSRQKAGNDSLSGGDLMLVGPGPRPDLTA